MQPFFLHTFIGALVLHVRCRTHKQEIFSMFQAVNINVGPKASPLIVTADMLISCLLGSLFIVFATDPKTNMQAVLGGFGMIGLFASLGNRRQKEPKA